MTKRAAKKIFEFFDTAQEYRLIVKKEFKNDRSSRESANAAILQR